MLEDARPLDFSKHSPGGGMSGSPRLSAAPSGWRHCDLESLEHSMQRCLCTKGVPCLTLSGRPLTCACQTSGDLRDARAAVLKCYQRAQLHRVIPTDGGTDTNQCSRLVLFQAKEQFRNERRQIDECSAVCNKHENRQWQSREILLIGKVLVCCNKRIERRGRPP